MDMTERLHFHTLEKEMATHSSVLAWRIRDGGAWWAAVYVVAQSRTRLKRLSSSNSSSRQLLPDQTILEGKGGDGVFLNFALRKITRDSSCGHL